MTKRTHLYLFFLGLAVSLVIAQFQPIPGYLDSDYYFAGGLQLAQGKGFAEPYLWNYLDDPQALPHPSNAYWMPLASIIAALGMVLTRTQTYAAGRLGFILIAALIPPLTAALAYTFSQRRELAILSALLSVLSVYHAPFMPVTDNFGIFMLLGGLYFLVSTRPRPWFWLGILAGLLALARSDGLLWLGLTILLILWRFLSDRKPAAALINFAIALGGFLLIIAPWYVRNYSIYGSLMAPGGSRTLWLANYDQTFSYPASQLTFETWSALGWHKIINGRLWALGHNLESAFAAHGAIILFPFILIGIWRQRADQRVRLAAVGWLALFAVMTIAFPFAGARGAFFHAGAAFQPLWWSLAPLGLETAVTAARKRGWFTDQAQVVFRVVLVQVVILLTAYVTWLRIFSLGWGEGERIYPQVESFLVESGAQPEDVVIVRNSPGYYIATGRSAIVIPYGDEETILMVAERYKAEYLVFEAQAALPLIKDLYETPQGHEHFNYLGELDGTQIFQIRLD